MRITYVVSLATSGGVETLLLDVLAHEMQGGRMLPAVVETSGRAEPRLRRGVSALGVPLGDAKRLGGLKIPRALGGARRRRLRRLVEASAPDVIVVLNDLSALEVLQDDRRAPVVHYEQGASWLSAEARAPRIRAGSLAGVLLNSRAAGVVVSESWGADEITPRRILSNPLRPASAPRGAPRAPRLERGRPVVVGVAGRLVPVKGIGSAILAIAELRRRGMDCRLEIAGAGPEREGLERLAAATGVAERIRFRGFVEDTSSFYDDIAVLAVPSIREPFGNVAVEAMAHARPVVAARVDGLAEVVGEGDCGLTIPPTLPIETLRRWNLGESGLPRRVFDPDRGQLRDALVVAPDALAAAIAEVVADPSRYEAMGRAALERVRSRYGFEDYMERYHAALREFVDARGAQVS